LTPGRFTAAGRRARGLAVAALLGTLASCGYSTKRLVSEPCVSTVAVLQFDNRTYRRDLEFRLTRAVAEEVRARTSWRIASPSSADALLSGTIHSADTTVLAEDVDSTPIVQRMRMVVDVKLVSRASGRVLREWRIVDRTEYTEGRFGETLDGSGVDRISRQLAEQVVQGLETPIGAPDAIPPATPSRVRRERHP
jgi:hypothetical protein